MYIYDSKEDLSNDGFEINYGKKNDKNKVETKSVSRFLGVDGDAARMEEEESMLRDANQLLNCVTSGEEIKEVIHPKTGATALHIAAAKGYIKVMKWVFFWVIF